MLLRLLFFGLALVQLARDAVDEDGEEERQRGGSDGEEEDVVDGVRLVSVRRRGERLSLKNSQKRFVPVSHLEQRDVNGGVNGGREAEEGLGDADDRAPVVRVVLDAGGYSTGIKKAALRMEESER